jgi:enoyl-CoA hydratase/carnithine racemase
VDPATAAPNGLFNKVVPAEKLQEEATAVARRLAQGPSFALGLTKEALNEEMGLNLLDALENEARAQAICMETHDFREAYDAFVAKRPPQFQGR